MLHVPGTRSFWSGQGGEAHGNVGELAVVRCDPVEASAGSWQVADALVHVSEAVPKPQVMIFWLLGLHRTLLEHSDSSGNVTLIRVRASEHYATFGHHIGVRVVVSQFVPELSHVGVSAERSSDVGPYRVLLGRAGHRPECLELALCWFPPAEPVVPKTEKLVEFRDARMAFHHRPEDLSNVVEALVLEGCCCIAETFLDTVALRLGEAAQGRVGETDIDSRRTSRTWSTLRNLTTIDTTPRFGLVLWFADVTWFLWFTTAIVTLGGVGTLAS